MQDKRQVESESTHQLCCWLFDLLPGLLVLVADVALGLALDFSISALGPTQPLEGSLEVRLEVATLVVVECQAAKAYQWMLVSYNARYRVRSTEQAIVVLPQKRFGDMFHQVRLQ